MDRDGGSHAVDTEMVTPLEKLVRASDEDCYTALHKACYNGRLEVAAALIEAGARLTHAP